MSKQYYHHIKKVDINGISKDVIQAATDGDVFMIYSRGSKYYKSLDDIDEVHVSNDTTLQQDFYQMVHKSNVARFDVKTIDDGKLYNDLMDLIPEEIIQIETPVCSLLNIHSGQEILPHVDKGRRTAINLYISGDEGSVVKFHETTVPIPEFNVHSRKNLNDSSKDAKLKMFLDYDNLKTIAKFEPSIGDMYMLDVSKIHSVNNLRESSIRVVVSYNFRKKFDELCVV